MFAGLPATQRRLPYDLRFRDLCLFVIFCLTSVHGAAQVAAPAPSPAPAPLPRLIRGTQVPAAVEKIYLAGMRYLAGAQNVEGSFGDQHGAEPATAALSAMAFLAHGDDPERGPYAQPVRRCIDYLLQKTHPNGMIGFSMYNHAFSTLALAEAYGSVRDEKIGPALKNAVTLILASQQQNPHHAWRYSATTKEADSTVTGACFVALIAARNAGLEVPESAIQEALNFLTECQVPADGTIGYQPKSYPHGPSTTAIGVAAFAYARQHAAPTCSKALTALKEMLASGIQAGHYTHYFEYYVAQALFQTDYPAWEKWNAKRIEQLSQMQSPDGSIDGPLGPSLSTAMGLLSLALNYRYLPVYER
jgi:hypothetical protein